MEAKRALAVRILLANVALFAVLALATWAGWIAAFEPRRGLMTAAFAACAALDAVLVLVLLLVFRRT